MSSRLPLAGIRVVEFAHYAVGPLLGKYLADHGAELIKVESYAVPDGFRLSGPFAGGVAGVNRSGTFAVTNSSKLSGCLNLGDPEGRRLAYQLISVSDIVISNFTSNAIRKLGLTYLELCRVKPDIILVTMPVEGATGPHRDYKGMGPTLEGCTGITGLTGWPGMEPVLPNTSITDWTGPLLALCALMGALSYRDRTGKGQYVDFSQLEAGIHCTEAAILEYTANGRELSRQGNEQHHAPMAPHGAFRCQGADRWCFIAVRDDQEWQRLCRVMGSPAWATREEFGTLQGRMRHQEELDRFVQEWAITLPPEEVMHRLQAKGIPVGVVQNGKDLCEDPQLKQRGHFIGLDLPDDNGSMIYDHPAFRLSASPAQVRRGPSLGEHDARIFGELLGVSDSEFVGLMERGVLGSYEQEARVPVGPG